ncbi:hypothetical protein RRG08_023715 [Elysia crispata]|uniref:Uncharacterized protein n=1 Tax=Elysia crispata TaxID=231223 RepID=A0AAE1DBW7_9GAST|nr:hypothetical protein RRG08_023715 [Elysia crispata]
MTPRKIGGGRLQQPLTLQLNNYPCSDKPVDLEVLRRSLDLASKVAREWNFLLPDQQTGPKKLLDSNAGLPNFSNLR